MDSFFKELRRRNIFRVAGVYAVVGWLLAQVAATLEGAVGLPAWFDGLVVSLLLLGFPVTLILAWAFEMTPEGVNLTKHVGEGESIAPKAGRKLDYTIVIGLALVAVFIVADRITGNPLNEKATRTAREDDTTPVAIQAANGVDESKAEKSVAVLPFVALSNMSRRRSPIMTLSHII